MKVLVAYDGSLYAKAALRYGIGKAKEYGGEVTVLYVFPSNMFIDYDASPKAEEIARAEASSHLEEAKRLIEEIGSDIKVNITMAEGNPKEEIIKYAKAAGKVDMILHRDLFL